MSIELTPKQIEILLRALGKEKTSLNNSGFYHLAHEVSDLQSLLTNGEK